MKARDLILVLLDAEGGTIESKTKIQKEIYFIAHKTGLDFNYRAHFYGPYSPEVQDGLEQLIAVGFVKVEAYEWGVDPRGFEMKRYDFSLTEAGRVVADSIKSKEADTFGKVQEFVSRLKGIGSPDYISLSIAAKVHFISVKEGTPINKAAIKAKASALGWKIEDLDIEKAEAILENLGYSKN